MSSSTGDLAGNAVNIAAGGLLMSLTGRIAQSGRFLFALAVCALIGGCGESPESPGATNAPGPIQPAIKTGQLPPEMVAAVAAGKTASAIGVHFALKSAPTVGQELQVDIALVPHQVFQSIRARFVPQEGMVISGGLDLAPQTGIKPEQIISHRLVLEPRREGIVMVTAAVETEGEEGSTVRVFSIPVIVHSQTPTPNAAPGPTETGTTAPAGP
jgi:hypothetical protein